MNGSFKVLSLFLVFFLLYGCSTTITTLTNEEVNFPSTNGNDIMITTKNKLDKPFREVGFISSTQTNIDAAKEILKDKAAQMGGDAILNFKITVVRQFIYIILIPVPIDNYICRGNVVRFI